MPISAQNLSIILKSSTARAIMFLPWITLALDTYAINTPLRQAHFFGQIGHESLGLLYTTELWGPTPTQSRYEGRADLGNVVAGDGSLFRGHGLIQTTGRTNHALTRDRLSTRFDDVPDFEANPLALAQPQWAALSAGDYWDMRKINQAADTNDIPRVTKLVNGGTNGLADRTLRTTNALRTLQALVYSPPPKPPASV